MLTTLDRAKNLLGIPLENTRRDVILKPALLAASDLIERYCQRTFKKQEYTERVGGAGTPFLTLKNFPIESVSKVDGLDDNNYEVMKDKGILFRKTLWPRAHYNYTVTYIAGYILPEDATDTIPSTLPDSLEIACAFFAQTILSQQQQSGVDSKRVGDISVKYTTEFEGANGEIQLPFVVRSLVDPYRGRWV